MSIEDMCLRRFTMRRPCGLGSALFILMLSAIASSHAQPPTWKPEKNVEIVVPSSPGGSNDRTARTINNILQAKQMVEPSTTVVNKPGGGGTIARAYLNQHAGDGSYFAVESINLLTDHIIGKTPLSYTDFTPLVTLYTEYIAFIVKADSPIKTGKDLVDLLRKNPQSLAIGISSTLGAANHIAFALAMRAAGVDIKKLKNVVFSSGGETKTSLLGGHVDVVPTSASNVVNLLTAGKVRVIAISSPQRLKGDFSEAPTWKEQGIDVVFGIKRLLIGPKGLSQAQIAYWNDVFAKLSETEEWRKDLEHNFWENDYMNSEKTRRDLTIQNDQLRVVLTDLGLAK